MTGYDYYNRFPIRSSTVLSVALFQGVLLYLLNIMKNSTRRIRESYASAPALIDGSRDYDFEDKPCSPAMTRKT